MQRRPVLTSRHPSSRIADQVRGLGFATRANQHHTSVFSMFRAADPVNLDWSIPRRLLVQRSQSGRVYFDSLALARY